MSAPATLRPAAWERPAPAATDDLAPAPVLEYLVLRLTGALLAVLVLGHFVVTHFVTDVAHDNSAFVARRLGSALWIAWDATMLAAAVAHGAAGVRLAFADGGRRRRVDLSVAAASAAVFAVGLAAIVRAANG